MQSEPACHVVRVEGCRLLVPSRLPLETPATKLVVSPATTVAIGEHAGLAIHNATATISSRFPGIGAARNTAPNVLLKNVPMAAQEHIPRKQ
jgi:hypothetical protein